VPTILPKEQAQFQQENFYRCCYANFRIARFGPFGASADRTLPVSFKPNRTSPAPQDFECSPGPPGGAALCSAAWLTSIVVCAANGAWPLLIATAAFVPVGVVHGVGIWFGGW